MDWKFRTAMQTVRRIHLIITLRKLKQHDKEIIVFNIEGFFDKMLEMIEEMSEKGFLYKQEELFKKVDTINEIFEII